MKPTKERRAWWRMKYRCYKPTHHKYPIYGGRGITVCDRWLCSFQHFLADVGPAPSPQHSIDRIDNNGNYEPGNVRWATRVEQGRNQRRNVLLTVDGITKTFTEWAMDSPLRPSGVRRRLERGMDAKSALFTPRLKPRRSKSEIARGFEGKSPER